MSSYQNDENRNDEDEISIIELIQMVFNHFFMIVGIVLLFCIIGVCTALFLLPEKHDIEALIYIKPIYNTGTLSKYGISYYNSNEVMNNMFSRPSIESAVPDDEELTYEEIREILTFENVNNTNLWGIKASRVKDTDLYVSIINKIVEKQIADLDMYKPVAENARNTIADKIRDYTLALENENATEGNSALYSILSNAENELQTVNNFIDSLPDAIAWNMKPSVSEKNTGTSKAMWCILFFLVGGIIGVVIAWIIDFSDKHIYNSEKLIEFCGSKKLLSSIPLYKGEIDNQEFSYLKSKIDSSYKNIVVTSISSRAGKTAIANGLKAELKNSSIADMESIVSDPDVMGAIKKADYALIVLRAGIDSFISLDKFITDLKLTGTDYGFVLNGVDVSDHNVIKYSDNGPYISHRWLLESWSKFYRKNYC